MSSVRAFVLLGSLLLAAAASAVAQSSGTQPAGASAPSPAPASVGPGEPAIVMPQVILQVEDLSVEKVVAQLPPEEDLLPPERALPVLSEGELTVGDPVLPSAGTAPADTGPIAAERALSSDVTLGAGMQNRIIGSMALKTLGADPRFALSFNHETLDGFAGHAAGAGFSLRNDLLDGSLAMPLGPVGATLGGSFDEVETGLQGLSPYVARLSRVLAGKADFTLVPLAWLTLGAGVDLGADSLTLEGSTPLPRTDFHVAPRLGAQARLGAVSFGLDASYAYRTDTGVPGTGLHRVNVKGSFSADIAPSFLLNGSVGWFGNSDLLSLVPFAVGVTATPWDFMTFTLGFGYSVRTYDLPQVLAAHSLALPGSLQDDRGWFGSGSFQFTLSRDVSLTVGAAYTGSEALPVGSTAMDPSTGLFAVTQAPGQQLSADAGLRWGISSAFSLSAGWHHEFLDRAFFTPTDTARAELVGLDPAGRFGGSFSVQFSPTPDGTLQQPLLRLSGFWNVSSAVKLQLDAEDLLWPLLSSPRTDLGSYQSPGFRVTGSVGMSL